MKYVLVQLAPVRSLHEQIANMVEHVDDAPTERENFLVRKRIERCLKAIIQIHVFMREYEDVISELDLFEFEDVIHTLGAEIGQLFHKLSAHLQPAGMQMTLKPPKVVSSYGDLLIEVYNVL